MGDLFTFTKLEQFFIQIILLLFAIIMLFPLYLAVINATKPSTGSVMTRPLGLPPAPASGRVFVYGTVGTVVPKNTRFTYTNDDSVTLEYESIETVTLEKNKARVKVQALFNGEEGNISRGETLQITQDIAGLESSAKIIGSGISYGAGWTWSNFVTAWKQANFGTYFLNSIIITLGTVIIVAVFGSMTSFVLARMPFRGSTIIFIAFMLGLVVPIRLALAPLFWIMSTLNLTDSLLGIILVLSAMSMPTAVLIMTTFLNSISPELEQAAKVDGASPFQIYYMVVIPLVKPALATVCLLAFVWSWNEYYLPLIFITSAEKLPLTMGLTQFKTQFSTQWHMMLAGILIMIVPTILAFLFASKQFISGLTSGGVKE